MVLITVDHLLAYGDHTSEQCGEWCSFPTGNERPAVPVRHTVFYGETGPAGDRTYLTFGCTACVYRDFVVAEDYEAATKAAHEAFRAVRAHM